MAHPQRLSQEGVGATRVVPLNYEITPFSVSVAVKVTGEVVYTVEHTFDDVFAETFDPDTATWFPHTEMVDATGSDDGSYVAPCTGVRVRISSGAGSINATVIQAG
jgi:hypothetical protein